MTIAAAVVAVVAVLVAASGGVAAVLFESGVVVLVGSGATLWRFRFRKSPALVESRSRVPARPLFRDLSSFFASEFVDCSTSESVECSSTTTTECSTVCSTNKCSPTRWMWRIPVPSAKAGLFFSSRFFVFWAPVVMIVL